MITMKKYILPVIMLVFLLQFAIAETDTSSVEDVFKLNEQVNYAKGCFNNGSYCSAAAVCNYTIFNPDKSVLVNSTTAQNNGNSHNVTFYVQNIGVYQADMTCCDGTTGCGSKTMFFEVTGTGFNNNLGFYAIILGLSFGLIILGFGLKDAPITIFGSFGLYFVGIYILFNGIAGVQDLVTTWATGIILLGVATYISTRSTYELIVD